MERAAMGDRSINATAASLLGLLLEAPMSGWDVIRVAQLRLGNFWSLTRSQVYRELAAMASAGLVAASARGPRERRSYSVTQAGRDAFAAYINAAPATETIRYPLLLTLSFGQHVEPVTLGRILRDQRHLHQQRLTDYEHKQRSASSAPHPDRWSLATLAFGIAHERATLDWFDQLSTLLPTNPSSDATARGRLS